MAAKKITKARRRYLKSLPPHMQPEWLREEMTRKKAKKRARKDASKQSTKTGGRKPRKMAPVRKARKGAKKRRVTHAEPA